MIIQKQLSFNDLITLDAQAVYDYIVVDNSLEDELDELLDEVFAYNTPTASDVSSYLTQNYMTICDSLGLDPSGIMLKNDLEEGLYYV